MWSVLATVRTQTNSAKSFPWGNEGHAREVALQLVSHVGAHCPHIKIWIWLIYLHSYVWFKYDLGQKYCAPQIQPEQGLNSWPPDHNSTFHATETPALTTWPSVTLYTELLSNLLGMLEWFPSSLLTCLDHSGYLHGNNLNCFVVTCISALLKFNLVGYSLTNETYWSRNIRPYKEL